MKHNNRLFSSFVKTAAVGLLLSGSTPLMGAEDTNIAPLCGAVDASYTASWNYLYSIYDGTTGYGELASAKTWADWQSNRPANAWLSYAWDAPYEINSVSIYFWTDTDVPGAGVCLPKSWKIQYLDSETNEWKNVVLVAGSDYTLNKTSPNKVYFEPVKTQQLRLWMDAAGNGSTYSAVGVTEWEVFGTPTMEEQTYGDYPIENLPFSAVHVSDSFWSPRIAQNQKVTIPIALKQCYDNGRLDNFKKAAGAMEGYFVGENTFDDTDIYKIIEGMSYSIQANYNKEMDDEMDMLIGWIARAQESDGYLMTARTAGEPGHLHPWLGENRWEKDPDLSHELYNAGHLYEAAVAHYISTGKRTLLDVALKNADLLVKDFLVGQLPYEPGHQIVEMGLVKLYRITGKQDYLKLAKYFLDLRGVRGQGRKEYSQSNKPVIAQTEAVGHAVRAGYMYSGIADVAAIMGNKAYLRTIDTLWDNVVSKKYYINGGIGALHNGEAFGANYELPNASAYCETCAAISNVYWNHRMFLLSGDAKYYDVLERSLYNGVISGIGLDGKTFFYPNPLASTGGYNRSEWFGCACCPSNLCRFIPSVPGYVYAHKGKDVYVNLYMQDTAKIPVGESDSIQVSQTTQYPWDGAIKVSIDGLQQTHAFRLLLRLPGWAKNQPVPSDLYQYAGTEKEKSISLYVNGKSIDYTMEKGYMVVDRTWEKGDSVTFSLPMDVHRVVANSRVTDDANRVALERGPLLYCLEWPDNQNQVECCMLPDDAEIHAEKSDLLGGVTLLKMNGLKASFDAYGSKVGETSELTAIPYYAWDNRGSEGQMEVWIPNLLSEVSATMGDMASDTLDVNLSMDQFLADQGGKYPHVSAKVDMKTVAQSLGVTERELKSGFGSKILFAAINPDGQVCTNSTANAPGHWFAADGYVSAFTSGTPTVFSEFDSSTYTFNVGQYPGRCPAGSQYTLLQSLSYLPGDGKTLARRVVFRIHLKVNGDATGISRVQDEKGKEDASASSTAVYDLCGRKVADHLRNFSGKKGVYIVNGKKIIR